MEPRAAATSPGVPFFVPRSCNILFQAAQLEGCHSPHRKGHLALFSEELAWAKANCIQKKIKASPRPESSTSFLKKSQKPTKRSRSSRVGAAVGQGVKEEAPQVHCASAAKERLRLAGGCLGHGAEGAGGGGSGSILGGVRGKPGPSVLPPLSLLEQERAELLPKPSRGGSVGGELGRSAAKEESEERRPPARTPGIPCAGLPEEQRRSKPGK